MTTPQTGTTSNRSSVLPLLFIFAIGASPWLLGANFPRGVLPTPLATVFGELLLLLPVTWLLLTQPVHLAASAKPVVMLWLAFAGYAALSLLWSYNADATVYHLIPLITAATALFAIAAWGNRLIDRRRLLTALLIGVALSGIYTIYQTFVGFGAIEQQLEAAGAAQRDIMLAQSMSRGFGTLIGPNPMGALLAVSVPLAWYALTSDSRRGARVFWAAVMLILVAGLFATGSRGALLVFLAEAAVIVFISMRGKFRRLSLYAVVAMVGGMALYEVMAWIILADRFTQADPLLGRMLSLLSMKDISLISRLRYWETAFYTGIGLAPLGSGWGAFESVCRAFQKVPVFSRSPHGIYFSVFAELGFAGLLFALAATLWPVAAFFRGIRRLRREGKRPGALAVMAALSYVGLLAHMCIDIDIEVPVLLLLLMVLGMFMMPAEDAVRPSLPVSFRPPMRQALLGVFGLLVIMVPAVFQGWEKTMTERAVALQSVQTGDAAEALQTQTAAIQLYQAGLTFWPFDALARLSWIDACLRFAPNIPARNCPEHPQQDLAGIEKAVPLHPSPVALQLDMLMNNPKTDAAVIRRQCRYAVSLNPTSLDFYNVCRNWLVRHQQWWDAYELTKPVKTLIRQYIGTQNPSRLAVYQALLLNADTAIMTCHPKEARTSLDTIITLEKQKYSTDSHLALTGPPVSAGKMAELARQRIDAMESVQCRPKPSETPSWWPYNRH